MSARGGGRGEIAGPDATGPDAAGPDATIGVPAVAGSSAAADMESWRPMAFGRRPARAVRDPLMEPLWPGRRVLVHIRADSRSDVRPGPGTGVPWIRIRDAAGRELAGHPDLRAALIDAARAQELVVDGYLLPLPPLDAALAVGPPEPDIPGVGAAARHLFLGTRSRAGGRGDRSAAVPPRLGGAGADSGAGTLTFVAIDLLALDGEPLVDVPLLERKRLLDSALVTGELVRLSPHVHLPAATWHRQWRALGFREMAVKEANGRYRPGEPSPDWSIAPIPTR